MSAFRPRRHPSTHSLRARLFRLLISVLLIGLGGGATVTAVGGPAAAAGPTAEFVKVSDWGSGWEGKYTILNIGTTAIDGWRLEFDLPAGTTIGAYWNALLTSSGDHHTFSARSYNNTIPAGGSVDFGFLGYGSGAPSGCLLNGADCGDGGDPGPGEPGVPGAPRVTGTTATSISLTWDAADGTVAGYRVYEGDARVAQVPGTSATITGLAGCSTHTYRVAAFNDDGESAASEPVTSTTDDCPDSDLPRHFLTGYWHNFVNPAVELKLSDVPNEYDVIAVAFGEATTTPGEVVFAVDPALANAVGGYPDAEFTADIRTLQARGKKVILSVGGELGRVSVDSPSAAQTFASSMHGLIQRYGFDGVDIDLEHGLNPTYMAQALRDLRGRVGPDLIITMAPQTIDMQSTGGSYFQLALQISDILTVVHMQYYNSGTMLGCDQQVYGQGTLNFLTALACIQLENGLRPDQVALGLPAGPGAAGGGVVSPTTVTNALDCLARGTNCGSFRPPRTYPGIRGAMTWSINWDVANGGGFARTVKAHLSTLP